MVGPTYTEKFNSKRSSGASKKYSRSEYIKEFGGSRMGNRRAHLLEV
jgi:hypothetical protein|tara:strand:- start:246 stop:386 length:141 start_codon:yes stop_codon:yes gene_type:complete